MSYILDAIKKSETERGNGSIPGLQTVHSSSLNYKTDSKQFWPYILIALLTINIAAIGFYFMNNNDKPQIAAIQVNEAKPPAIPKTVTTAPQTRLTQTRPVETTIEPASIKPQNTLVAVPDTDQAITSREVITIDDLPTVIKQRIPTMEYSGHVYSSSPAQRSIIINGSFKEEGDPINHEITLIEITSNGAVFDYQGTLFEVSVLTGWNIN